MPDFMEYKTALILLVSGFFGSLIRIIRKPHDHWKQWVIQFIVGILSAIFIGGFLSHLLINATGLASEESQLWATAATAYVIGTSAERLIEVITARIERSV